MKILLSWLRDYVDVTATPADIAETLTLRGFEVAALEAAPAVAADETSAASAGKPDPVTAKAAGADSPGRPDAVLDLEITANRPDCLSIVGIAREVATAYQLPLRNVPLGLVGPELQFGAQNRGASLSVGADAATATRASADGLTVLLEDADRCPRYSAAVADVKIADSPAWLANRLVAAGVRPINNVVDITNYVMLELGHPLHAFDLARLGGQSLRIRTARAGEQMYTLDGERRTLDPDMLVIADADHAQAIAGVMGGAASEVWAGTRTIAIESAYFKPASVRRTGKRVGLKTEASARFERGANINAAIVALSRVLDLLEQTQAGSRRGTLIDCYPSPRPAAQVTLRRQRIGLLLGRPVPDAIVERLLDSLGFRPQPAPDGWQTTVPGWRVDVTGEADLIEELARHDGYEKIPVTFPPLQAASLHSDRRIGRDALVRRVMTAAGLSEAITFVFIDAAAARPFAPGVEPVALAYPLSEKFAVLRPSLLPGLVDAVAYNLRRERRDVRLFEIGSAFSAEAGERRAVALAWSGGAGLEHWSGSGRSVDFYDAKGVVENLFAALGVHPRFIPGDTPYLVEGRRAAVLCDDIRVGIVGQLAPTVAAARDLPAGEEVYVAEIDLSRLPQAEPVDVLSQSPPRHPSVVRDLSIVVSRTLPAEAVRGTIVAAAPSTLAMLREFDRYQGKGIPEDAVSLSFHLVFRSAERTLTDAEVQQAMDAIVEALAREHHAVRR